MKKEKVIIGISGMHCASCAGTIEKKLGKKDGIISVLVNFASEKATIEYDASIISMADLISAINSTGYKAVVGQQDNVRKNEITNLKIKLIIGIIFTVPVFLGSFPEFFFFVPEMMRNLYILLAITIPVQFYAGAQFYRGAWNWTGMVSARRIYKFLIISG